MILSSLTICILACHQAVEGILNHCPHFCFPCSPSRGSTMAMTMTPTTQAPPPPVKEQRKNEADEMYGKVRAQFRNQRGGVLRRAEPYFYQFFLTHHRPLATPCVYFTHFCRDTLPQIDQQQFHVAEYWISVIVCKERTMPETVQKLL